MSTKRTYRPHKTKRARGFGFRIKNKIRKGRKILKRRILKGRKRV